MLSPVVLWVSPWGERQRTLPRISLMSESRLVSDPAERTYNHHLEDTLGWIPAIYVFLKSRQSLVVPEMLGSLVTLFLKTGRSALTSTFSALLFSTDQLPPSELSSSRIQQNGPIDSPHRVDRKDLLLSRARGFKIAQVVLQRIGSEVSIVLW